MGAKVKVVNKKRNKIPMCQVTLTFKMWGTEDYVARRIDRVLRLILRMGLNANEISTDWKEIQ